MRVSCFPVFSSQVWGSENKRLLQTLNMYQISLSYDCNYNFLNKKWSVSIWKNNSKKGSPGPHKALKLSRVALLFMLQETCLKSEHGTSASIIFWCHTILGLLDNFYCASLPITCICPPGCFGYQASIKLQTKGKYLVAIKIYGTKSDAGNIRSFSNFKHFYHQIQVAP